MFAAELRKAAKTSKWVRGLVVLVRAEQWIGRFVCSGRLATGRVRPAGGRVAYGILNVAADTAASTAVVARVPAKPKPGEGWSRARLSEAATALKKSKKSLAMPSGIVKNGVILRGFWRNHAKI
jgi:hypothetical protein